MFRAQEMRGDAYVEGLIDLARVAGARRGKMVEVGSFIGESALIFAGYFDSVTCVDPWVSGYDPTDGASSCDMAAVEAEFDRRTAHIPNISKMKATSLEAASRFADRSLDFVYLDGCHRPEAVFADAVAWERKVKIGGFFGGHDIDMDGVRTAVSRLFVAVRTLFKDNSWLTVITDPAGSLRRTGVPGPGETADFARLLYSGAFVEGHEGPEFDWEEAAGEAVSRALGASSVIDVGCGNGRWLLGASRHCAGQLTGTDISEEAVAIARRRLAASGARVAAVDLCSKEAGALFLGEHDLALSVETAEHLPEWAARGFAGFLVRHSSKNIVVTAAPPGQSGMGHVHCAPKEKWISVFAEAGARRDRAVEEAAAAALSEAGAPGYILRNMIGFSK